MQIGHILKAVVLEAVVAGALATGGLAVAGIGVADAPAGAAASCAGGTIVVSNSLDSGPGSLRQAFADANTADGGTICIDTTVVTAPIAVTSGVLDYTGTGALTIQGNGATVQGDGSSGLIDASTTGQTLEADDLTITGGNADAGGGIRSGNGTVKLVRSSVVGNTATSFAAGASGVTVIVIDSTIANNTVTDGDGAGINAGTATVINSTITGNSASTEGGGIEAGTALTLVYATVVGNHAPDAANISTNTDQPMSSFGSVVSGATGGGQNCDLQNGTSSNGFNWSDDESCGFTDTGSGDVQDVGGSPLLGALGANGGPTETMLPGTGSPLIDAIPAAHCQDDGASGITTDQRGVTRPQLGGCDIGAVEVEAPTPVPPTPPAPPGPPAAAPLVVTPHFTG